MSDLSPLARRAIHLASQNIRSPGWSFGFSLFAGDEEITQNFHQIAAELVSSGYLTKSTMLLAPTKDFPEVLLSDEEAAEAERCIAANEEFTHPESGEEMLLGPNSTVRLYSTTDLFPVTPPPPDERAVALQAEFLARQGQSPCQATYAAWQQALDLLGAKFGLSSGQPLK